MCYSSKMSFSFFFIGILTTIYIQLFSPVMRATYIQFILLFYSLMELLQCVQYYYVNQCTNIINKLLTEVAYLFVIVQPLMWNAYFYVNTGECDKKIFLTAIALSICWMFVNVCSRLLYNTKIWPYIQTEKNNTAFAGADGVCTKKKLTHLYWEWTSANFFELNATFLTFLLMWFVPALLSVKHRMTSLILICSAIVAAYSAFSVGESFIFTSLWCYISVPIVLIVIANLLIKKNIVF